MNLLTRIWNALFSTKHVEVTIAPSHTPLGQEPPLERENYLFQLLDGTTAETEDITDKEKELHQITINLTGDTQEVVAIKPKRKKKKKKPAISGETQTPSITIDATKPKSGTKNQPNGTKTRTNSRKPKQVAPVQPDSGDNHGSGDISGEQQSV